MKYALAALAVVAAVAALFFRPPQLGVPLAGPAIQPADDRGPTFAGRASGASRGGSSHFERNAATVVVYVAGDVRHPGVYAMPAGERAQAAVARAGGALADADLVAVNLAAPLADGDEIAVPRIGEPAARGVRGRDRPAHARRSHRHSAGQRRRAERNSGAANVPASVAVPASIDLNEADETELERVPGIGPRLAARIVQYREANGPFRSLDELADIDGISDRVEEALAAAAFVR